MRMISAKGCDGICYRTGAQLVLIALAGCAADSVRDPAVSVEKRYVTGSNLPAREHNPVGVTTASKEDFDRASDRTDLPARPATGR